MAGMKRTKGPGKVGRWRNASGTREALLAAGTELFAERGYDGVPVWAIAQMAGVNKAMVSYHFGGKRKLYRAIVDATFADIISRVERLAASSRTASELLRELVAVMGDMATRRNPHFCTMMLREALSGGKHLDPEVAAKPLRVLAAVRQILERGVREGDFRPVDPVLTHLSLVGSLVFFFATARFRERMFAERLGMAPPDAQSYVRHIQDLISGGLAADRARAQASDAEAAK
jgi:TetR/AcrR family transcriptional regulator